MSFNNTPPVVAGGTIGVARFVKPSAVDDNAILQGTSGVSNKGDACVGISQPWQRDTPGLAGSDDTLAASAGDQCRMFSVGDYCYLEAGLPGFVHGDYLKRDPNGMGIKGLTGDIVCAIAWQTATNGQRGYVQILVPRIL